MADRTVHAEFGEQQLVRADRSGKWYLVTTTKINLAEAVEFAQTWRQQGGKVYLDRRGGALFDARLRRLPGSADSGEHEPAPTPRKSTGR